MEQVAIRSAACCVRPAVWGIGTSNGLLCRIYGARFVPLAAMISTVKGLPIEHQPFHPWRTVSTVRPELPEVPWYHLRASLPHFLIEKVADALDIITFWQ
jgi:hypothetical protein